MAGGTRAKLYLLIIGAALLVWFPLYPVLFALSYDQSPQAVKFLETRPFYVYFGDSVLATSTPCEADHRSVMDFLPEPLGARTMAFNGGGGNANLWRSIARFVAARGAGTVSAAIIPINMGVFSVGWEYNPDYNYEQGRMFYSLASGHFSAPEYLRYLADVHSFLKTYRSDQAAAAWKALPVTVGTREIGNVQAVSERMQMPVFACNVDLNRYAYPLGQRFSYNYGAPVSADDPYFAYLGEIAVRLRQANIRTVFYITPLNEEDISRFGGAPVMAQLNANLALVRRIASEKGWDMMDLSAELPSRHFITRECACEHVDAVGRALIARKVAAALIRDPL